jgi:hypothetical protein
MCCARKAAARKDQKAGPGRVGFFVFPQVPTKYKIPAGFEAEWVTVNASPELSA